MTKKSKNKVIARSPRLYLSDFGLSYAEALQKWLHDPKVYGHLRNLEEKLTLEDQIAWINFTARDPTLKVFSVHYIPDDRLIGFGGFKNINTEDQVAEVWRVIGETQYHGRGLGTELYWLFCDYGFKQLGFKNILAEHFANNLISMETAMKCGAKKMGLRREAKWLGGQWFDAIYTDLLPHELIKPAIK